ncbi:MAG TPA: KEOPS complex subunit Pcc1 [Geobacterales bacterium]|nr:KEOPS complex subunit Pcc1 [Geobacterales bacterium]
MKLSLRISCSSKEEAAYIFNALNPDNRNVPKDLKLELDIQEDEILIVLESENLRRVRSTVDEILSLISSMEKL